MENEELPVTDAPWRDKEADWNKLSKETLQILENVFEIHDSNLYKVTREDLRPAQVILKKHTEGNRTHLNICLMLPTHELEDRIVKRFRDCTPAETAWPGIFFHFLIEDKEE